MSYGQFRVLTEEEKEVCRENGIDPRGKSAVLAGEEILLLLHHKTRDHNRISYGQARMREQKEAKSDRK